MREPRPDWSPLGVNFKILDEHPYLFIYRVPPPPPPGEIDTVYSDYTHILPFLALNSLLRLPSHRSARFHHLSI